MESVTAESIPNRESLLPLYARLRCGLLPIASSTGRRFPSRSPKYFQWHEPVEIGQGQATTFSIDTDRWQIAWQKGSQWRLQRAGWANSSHWKTRSTDSSRDAP